MKEPSEFRAELRKWLNEHCPASMRTSMPADEYPTGGRKAKHKNPDTKRWMDLCAERGLTVPDWPAFAGGAGFDKDQMVIWREEMGRLNARPPLGGMGVNMIGPALLEYGSKAQQLEHLPRIARGEIRWCQGYSEPGSGSDLASLRSSAVEDGDDFIINGQKIWTSGADHADWMFGLVRTEPEASKQEGISFILIDMESPGITIRPIKLISGASLFCETFFENVRVPKANLVHERGKGWTVGKRLLQYERSSIGSGGSSQQPRTLEDFAREHVGAGADGRLSDEALRDAIARHRMNDHAFRLTTRRSAEESSTGKAPGALSSMFKYYGTEQNKRKLDLLLRIMGTRALGWEGPDYADDERVATRAWLRSKANSIEGGTSEVQLNIISKRILELPD